MDFAIEHALVVKLLVQPGTFMIRDDLLCDAFGKETLPEEAQETLRNCFVFGRFPTCEQDILFPINQLEEMAIRALSPGINDPHTAMECIDYLATSLRAIAKRPSPSAYRADEGGTLRVITPVHNFEKILRSAFQQIHHYGREDIDVVSRIFTALQKIGDDASIEGSRRDTLAKFAKELVEKSETCAICPGDQDRIRAAYRSALEPHLIEMNYKPHKLEPIKSHD
jgi:uncharacterized membrane protein